MGTWGGGRTGRITRYPRGAWGRGEQDRCGRAERGAGVGVGVERRELGFLLPHGSLSPSPGSSPAAGICPAATVEAVSGLKSFEENCSHWFKSFMAV